jgi:hypothetical protein
MLDPENQHQHADHQAGGRSSAIRGMEFAAGYEYELVPGTWTRRLFVDGVQVFEMSFEVKINHDQP